MARELTTLTRFSNELENEALDKKVLEQRQKLENSMQPSEQAEIYLNSLKEDIKKRTVYKMVFTAKDSSNALLYYDEEDKIAFKMLPEDLYPNAEERKLAPERQLVPAAFINRDITARVKEIDVENRIVYMVYANASARSQINDELTELFAEAKRENCTECVKGVTGTIMRVFPRYAIVSIVNKGVIGFIHISNWSEDFTTDLTYTVNVGDVYTFDIVEMEDRGVFKTFRLDHKPYSMSCWSQIPENVDLRNYTIPVKCIEVNVGMHTWRGTVSEASTPLPKGMELFGEYKTGENALIPVVGKLFSATVSRFDRNNKRIKVELYRAVQENSARVGRPLPLR